MAFTMQEITIVGSSELAIDASVGDGGVNDIADVLTIQTLLNGIPVSLGGSDGGLTLEPEDIVGPQRLIKLEPLIQAIVRFQAMQPGLVQDGRVDPEKNTIKRMRALFRTRRGGGVDSDLVIRPAGPIAGPCNGQGFSAARLKKGAKDWDAIDRRAPIRQFLPVGGRRTLVATSAAGGAVSASISGPKAVVESVKDGKITIVGRLAGEETLEIRHAGHVHTVKLTVRDVLPMAFDIVLLGDDPTSNQSRIADFVSVMSGIVAPIYLNQANVVFSHGNDRVVDKISRSASPFTIDPFRKLTLVGTGEPVGDHIVSDADLIALIRDRTRLTIFLGKIVLKRNPRTVGQGVIGGAWAWFNDTILDTGQRGILPAHEIGHTLGFNHVTALTPGFLMNEFIMPANVIIPCETLADLP
ncbi:hypothetical protein [Prosthecomicrobium sp. N25]|uniref:hypothetical protein n=1 Tax=Prosthecomicrobium sp. N25 TaxID=3129254 RepID=UPI003076A11C